LHCGLDGIRLHDGNGKWRFLYCMGLGSQGGLTKSVTSALLGRSHNGRATLNAAAFVFYAVIARRPNCNENFPAKLRVHARLPVPMERESNLKVRKGVQDRTPAKGLYVP
jgi:hypothetical protein